MKIKLLSFAVLSLVIIAMSFVSQSDLKFYYAYDEKISVSTKNE